MQGHVEQALVKSLRLQIVCLTLSRGMCKLSSCEEARVHSHTHCLHSLYDAHILCEVSWPSNHLLQSDILPRPLSRYVLDERVSESTCTHAVCIHNIYIDGITYTVRRGSVWLDFHHTLHDIQRSVCT